MESVLESQTMYRQEEKLCLKWNDFQENAISAFGTLREDREFADVTLACEDGQQVEAHKVILASSSPFFLSLLSKNKHPHPLIYMRGLKFEDLVAMVDFLYFGEANVYQENLDSFLALAEEIQLKGLTGNDETKETEIPKQVFKTSSSKLKQKKAKPSVEDDIIHFDEDIKQAETALVPSETFIKSSVNNDDLDSTISSMMQKNNQGLWSCTICGKSDTYKSHMKNHIEAKHIEGASHLCGQCGKLFRSRNSLAKHLSVYHKEHVQV